MDNLIVRFAALAMAGMLCTGAVQAAGLSHKSKQKEKMEKRLVFVHSNAPRFVDYVDARDVLEDVPTLVLEKGAEGMPGSVRRAMARHYDFPAAGGEIVLRGPDWLDDERRHWLLIARFAKEHDFMIPTVVPEADTALMLALGLPLTLLLARRRRQA